MLRDDAIRLGLIEPSKEDIKRMNLTELELSDIATHKKLAESAEKKGKRGPKSKVLDSLIK